MRHAVCGGTQTIPLDMYRLTVPGKGTGSITRAQ